ncbi:MAG: biotin/lipoyl-containing protein [Xanthobacteraceae bacterium]
MRHTFDLDGESRALWLSRREGGFDLHLADGWSGPATLVADGAGAGTLTIAGSSEPVVYVVDGDTVHVHLRGQAWSLRYIDPLQAFAGDGAEAGHDVARAPMPGTVISVAVAAGDRVTAGTVLMIIESMKLETSIRASHDGVVDRVHLREGESFDRDAILITLSQGQE